MIYKLSITLSKIHFLRSIRKKKKKPPFFHPLVSRKIDENSRAIHPSRSSLLASSFPCAKGNSSTLGTPIPSFTRYTFTYKAKETRRRTGRRSSSTSTSRAQAENRHRKWNERGKSQRGLEERRWRLQAWPSGG